MIPCRTRAALLLVSGFALAGCGGGGGGGSGTTGGGGGGGEETNTKPPTEPPPVTAADQRVETISTTVTDGSYADVDLIDGGNPDSNLPIDVAKRNFMKKLASLSGVDIDGNGLQDSYKTGIAVDPFNLSELTVAANNLYDLFQTTTGAPEAALVDNPPTGFLNTFEGFNGGDVDQNFTGGDVTGDGGAGLFSNVPGSTMPKLPVLPYTMGTLSGTGSGRGASATDQHQFVQIVFPYNIDKDSLFNLANTTNSFLGDSSVGATDNVFMEARWVEKDGAGNVVDQTFQHRHVSGVAIIGGVSAIPTGTGTALATVDVATSNLPAGCLPRVMLPNVLTIVAHENPTQITKLGSALVSGTITGADVLVLPSPTGSPGGGRVFGGTPAIPGSVNDFAADGNQAAAPMGFFSVRISRLRSAGKTIESPYFHSFAVDQSKVGADPRSADGTFNRGAAIYVNETTAIPDIELFDTKKESIGDYDLVPASDAVNLISTRARFLVRFDREVVPNSVGFSRRHTIHSTPAQGVIFPFNGNTRPIASPATALVPGKLGSPLAPSIFLAVNQPAGLNKAAGSPSFGLLQKVNSLVAKSGQQAFDNGTPFNASQLNGNGLVPQEHNTLATLPRGVVPCDIYPLNQNNLNAYVVQPLVELPPLAIVTLGVCMPGVGFSVLDRTNHGNFTRSGTMFTSYQGLSSVGLGEDASQKTAIIGNDTVIKVNAGPMDLQGRLLYGGTSVAVDTLINLSTADDTKTGGSNICRTFRVGTDNLKLYVNAPVCPQALYLGFNAGGIGVLDLSGTGYNTNRPGGAADNAGLENYLEVSRYLPTAISGNLTLFNYKSNGAVSNGDHFKAFGIISRYTSGGASNGLPPGTESEWAIGAAIPTGSLTPVPGINEGSSGYETLVSSGIINNDASTSTEFLATAADVGIVRDIEVGDFLDCVYFDAENPFTNLHRTYNTPQQGSLDNNTIADPPLPNPPPLRFPVGLPHTTVSFDQSDLEAAPFIIDGNEVFAADLSMMYDAGTGFSSLSRPVNGFIQLNPTANTDGAFDVPHLPNAGFTNPFPSIGGASTVKFVQTGPMPKTATAGAVILTTLNKPAPGTYDSGGLVPPVYQSRQQIGNFLFVADSANQKLHVLNSNTMQKIQSLTLPDPTGLGLSPNLDTLYVSNEGDNSLSVIDADPNNPTTFMTEIKRIPVGSGPRAVSVSPNDEDVFVLNYLASTITIVDVSTKSVRKTLQQNGISRPYDIAIGARESTTMPGFNSGTFHAYISNFGGNNVLIYEGGPSGLGGIGWDNIIGAVRPNEPAQSGTPLFKEMFQPRGIAFDPVATGVTFFNQHAVGCFVAHKDQSGRGLVTRITYDKDTNPGQGLISFIGTPNFGSKLFDVTGQYLSSFVGVAYDVALPDFSRSRLEAEDFGSFYNLFNAGATPKTAPQLPRNSKFPTADNILPFQTNAPRWEPDRLYLSMSGHIIEVFDIETSAHLKTITTPQDVSVIASYFSQ